MQASKEDGFADMHGHTLSLHTSYTYSYVRIAMYCSYNVSLYTLAL